MIRRPLAEPARILLHGVTQMRKVANLTLTRAIAFVSSGGLQVTWLQSGRGRTCAALAWPPMLVTLGALALVASTVYGAER
jgi:hypothetical protein